MQGVVESYEEEIVVAPQRRLVHVVDSVSAHIEAWHGGRMVTEMGAWSSVAVAIREAMALSGKFGVTSESSMTIVIREEISRRRVVGDKIDLDLRGETVVRQAVIAERYVHDVVMGAIPASWRMVEFEYVMPILFRKATDWPGEKLPDFFRPLTIGGWRSEFLRAGHGYRNMRVTSATSRPAAKGEMPKDAHDDLIAVRPSQCWVVVFSGTIEIAAPAARTYSDLVADLVAQNLCVDIDLDQKRDNGIMNRDRWTIWTGLPAAKMTWIIPN